jgi:hypothetical protein
MKHLTQYSRSVAPEFNLETFYHEPAMLLISPRYSLVAVNYTRDTAQEMYVVPNFI